MTSSQAPAQEATVVWGVRMSPKVVAALAVWLRDNETKLAPADRLAIITKSGVIRVATEKLLAALVASGDAQEIESLEEATETLIRLGYSATGAVSGLTKNTGVQLVKAVQSEIYFNQALTLDDALAASRRDAAARPKPAGGESPALRHLNMDRYQKSLGPLTEEQWDIAIAQGLDALSVTVEQIDACFDAESERLVEKDKLDAAALRQATLDMLGK